MSMLIKAEKLRRNLEKARMRFERKRAENEVKHEEKVRELRRLAGDEVCCLLDSAANLGKAAE